MKSVSTTKKRGFTIVELLVVIVVVAILAAISIAVYGNVQARAEKAKTVAAARNFIQSLTLYKTGEGQYPTTATYCLGEGYTDRTGDGQPDCRWNSGNVNPDDPFNETLAKYSRVQADITQKPVMNGSSGVVGMYFMNDALGMLDGEPQHDWLVYAVADKKCGLTVPQLTETYPEFVTKSNDTASEDWGQGGLCWIPLK